MNLLDSLLILASKNAPLLNAQASYSKLLMGTVSTMPDNVLEQLVLQQAGIFIQ